MLKTIAPFAMAAAVLSAPAFAQQISHAPGGTSVQNADPYNSGNPTEQYLQQKSLDNLPGQQAKDSAATGSSRRARPTELIAGATVKDKTGIAMATIAEVDPDGIVVSDGTLKVKVPAGAFGHNKAGLLLDMTKAQFDQIVQKANAAS